MNRSDLVHKLQAKPQVVTFRKVSTGEIRKMLCTLEQSKLPALMGSNHRKNMDVLPVWDIEAEGWRSFRLDTVIEVKDADGTN